MKKEELSDYGNGLYKVFWKSGGYSLAAIGSLYDGSRWLAPTNWTNDGIEFKAPSNYWRNVKSLELIQGY